jgi:hypothetical protein
VTIVPQPKVFDDFVRTDPRPANGEDSFSFLNRVASPYWQRVRDFIEAAFAEYPRDDAADIRARFRDRRWPEHVGAWWELYLHALFRAFGFSVEVHPALDGTTARPDFRVWTPGGVLLVEARYVAAGLVSSEQRVGRDDWIIAPLNDLTHPDFMVSIQIHQRGAPQPRRTAVTSGVLEWLDGLDADALAEQSFTDLPRFQGCAGDWRFELQPIAVSRKARGRQRRLVGMGPATGGYDNTVSALRRALKEKARRYGRPSDPLILAVLTTSGFTDTEDVVDALFGSQAVQFDPGRPHDATMIRRRDGFWIAGAGYRGTRISAVLIGDAILPWSVTTRLPRLWVNPGAANPMGAQLDLPTARIDDEGKLALAEAEISAARRFGLNEEWPGPGPPFAREGISG